MSVVTNLYSKRPAGLDHAQKKLDSTVAATYRWPADFTDEHLVEKLLALNLERANEEAKIKMPKTPREKRADELV